MLATHDEEVCLISPCRKNYYGCAAMWQEDGEFSVARYENLNEPGMSPRDRAGFIW